MLKFYNRETEMALLNTIEQRSQETAQMTIVVGRRRVGKTALLNKVFSGENTVYFFVEKKNETLLCDELLEEIRLKLGTNIYGQIRNFKDVFAFLMDLSQNRHFTLIIDEFQEFRNINTAIYSEMQNVWDSKKDTSKLNLVLCGSVYSLMTKIFQNSKEPLFGRATAQLLLKAFDIKSLKNILNDYYPEYKNEDLLAFYLFTGGVAKYVELLVSAKAFTKKKILKEIFSENSFFLNEGKNVLIEEFGKDYGNYFSILSLIASSRTSRSEMESMMQTSLGGYLDKLDNEYNLIKKIRPIGTKPTGKEVKYQIEDNFLNFWFRFIYKYRSAIEIGRWDYVSDIVERDYETYSGLILEKYFTAKMIESKQFIGIGSYWDKKNENQIDIVALRDEPNKAVAVEVKLQRKNYKPEAFALKVEHLKEKVFRGYEIEPVCLSLEDM
ncbi:MAG: AAA family ATPase [Dysgonamonadaceae bacterium]|jgi:AAA+ ATPase superfamily predicted ATPase|nr:AAA family ATPase [Dysgonamonadaceae bacterium]